MNTAPITSLREAIPALTEAAARDRAKREVRSAELQRLIHDAEAREHRRAANNAIDRAKYRIGGAFEANEALDLDPVTMTGWLAGGPAALLLLVEGVLASPEQSLAASLRTLFRSPAGPSIRAGGVWASWHRLKALYDEEVAAVEASDFGQDPRHPARRKKPTRRQTYLAAEIVRVLQIEPRTFGTRGEAHDWLYAQRGNPRFWSEPPGPDLDGLIEDPA